MEKNVFSRNCRIGCSLASRLTHQMCLTMAKWYRNPSVVAHQMWLIVISKRIPSICKHGRIGNKFFLFQSERSFVQFGERQTSKSIAWTWLLFLLMFAHSSQLFRFDECKRNSGRSANFAHATGDIAVSKLHGKRLAVWVRQWRKVNFH